MSKRYCPRCNEEVHDKSAFCSIECALKHSPVAKALSRAAKIRTANLIERNK